MASTFTFGRISDAQVIELGEGLLNSFVGGSLKIYIGDDLIIDRTKGVEGSEKEGDEDEEEEDEEDDSLRNTLGTSTYFITRMEWYTQPRGGHRINYHRSRMKILNSQGSEAWTQSPNPFVDSIEYVGSNIEHFDVVIQRINAVVSMAPPVAAGADLDSAVDQSTAILNRMSDAIAKLVEHTSERQKDLDKTRASISKEADSSVKARKEELDKNVEGIRLEYEKKASALAERESELDDRANTHVRREFAKEMANLSDTRLSKNLLSSLI